MRSVHTRAVLALACYLALARTAFGAAIDDRISEQKKQLALLNKRIQFHSQELAQAKKKEKSYLRELSVFDHRVKQSESQIELLDLQIEKNEDEIARLNEDIGVHQKKVDELRAMLAERYVAIYKYSGVSDLNVGHGDGPVVQLLQRIWHNWCVPFFWQYSASTRRIEQH